MRKYKHLFIPDRFPRTDDNIYNKQSEYCSKSNCHRSCLDCLFHEWNIEYFKNWYMAKNKPKESKGYSMKELIKDIHENAKAHGWHDND